MGYGLSFKGTDNVVTIGTYGDNYYFYKKITAPSLRTDPKSIATYANGYIVDVPSGEIPLIFVYSSAGVVLNTIGPYKLNSTRWYSGYIRNTRSNFDVTLYVFLRRRPVQKEEAYGISTYDASGNLVYTSDSSKIPLAVAAHKPDINYFDEIPFSANASKVYYPGKNGETFSELGVSKPGWFLPNAYLAEAGGDTLRLGISINSTGTFSLYKMRCEDFSGGITNQLGITPIGVPFIDCSFYD